MFLHLKGIGLSIDGSNDYPVIAKLLILIVSSKLLFYVATDKYFTKFCLHFWLLFQYFSFLLVT